MHWYQASSPTLVSIAEKTFTENRSLHGNCLKGCKWAPDGSCIATNSEDHKIRIFNLPAQFCSPDTDKERTVDEMNPDLQFKEAQIIYDYSWYPLMISSEPATCFLLCASRDVPVHLWDAYSGKVSASYSALNNVYELVSARSIQFSPDGSRIIAGYEKFICMFDISKPGNTDNVPNGIVSCIASGNKMFASGSFSNLIGLYDSTSLENTAILQGQQGGITHLLIDEQQNRLFSGARKDDEILCWDLRNLGTILHVTKRNCNTNQRLYFDINFEQNVLMTGDNTGKVFIYDLQSKAITEESKQLSFARQFQAHDTCVNGVGLHPSLPILATTSGERSLLDFDECSDDRIFDYTKTCTTDTNLKFWSFGSK